jgi:hypothetical protein
MAMSRRCNSSWGRARGNGCPRLRRILRMLAVAHPPVLPSAMRNNVGTLVAIISQLNTLPACTPVNASMAASRLATHDSGQDGSLLLSCMTVSFTTPRRFIPADFRNLLRY